MLFSTKQGTFLAIFNHYHILPVSTLKNTKLRLKKLGEGRSSSAQGCLTSWRNQNNLKCYFFIMVALLKSIFLGDF
jgi:hypothetical protein